MYDPLDDNDERRIAALREDLKKYQGKKWIDSYYSEWRWIARNAGVKEGMAYFRFKEAYDREPTEEERNLPPTVPNSDLIILCQGIFSEYRYNKLLHAYEWAKMPEEEKVKILNERKQAKKFKARVFRELDAHRPKLEDL